jgi:hypothetical protein
VCDEDEGSDDELMMSDNEAKRGQFEILPDNPLSSSGLPSIKHVASSPTSSTKHVASSLTPSTKHVSSSRTPGTKHNSSVSDKTVELPAPLPSSFSASAKTTDPHIGVACWVTTVNEEKEVRKSGDYKAVYPQWPGYLAKIQNIHDTKEVILQPKEKEEANADKSICDYCGEKLILS